MREIPIKLTFNQQERVVREKYRFARNYREVKLIGNCYPFSINIFEVVNFEYIEKLHLKNCDFGGPSIFRSLLRRCGQLKDLSLVYVGIGQRAGDGSQNEICVKRDLDVLSIETDYRNNESTLILLKAIAAENIKPKYFKFDTRDLRIEEFSDVLKCLHQHYTASLKKFQIGSGCVDEYHAAMDLLKVPEFKFKKLLMYHPKDLDTRCKAFGKFLANQTELTHFEITHELLTEWHLETMSRSLSNLTHLTLSLYDHAAFNRCVHRLDKLKTLKLTTLFTKGDLALPKNLETFTKVSPWPRRGEKVKINFLLSPLPSLTTLYQGGNCNIDGEQMEKFFKYCPNMELFLFGDGNCGKTEELAKASAGTAAECSLANWKKLRIVFLQRNHLHDAILTLIESDSLKAMAWIINQEELIVSFKVKN
jgi:hypothetical protein